MCVVSMIMDHYRERWEPYVIPQQPWPTWPQQPSVPDQMARLAEFLNPKPQISPEEVAEFRKLLERAREYDKRNNEPDCELAEKRNALLVIAKALGVELSFL